MGYGAPIEPSNGGGGMKALGEAIEYANPGYGPAGPGMPDMAKGCPGMGTVGADPKTGWAEDCHGTCDGGAPTAFEC